MRPNGCYNVQYKCMRHRNIQVYRGLGKLAFAIDFFVGCLGCGIVMYSIFSVCCPWP
jgi:hypothetical protein